MTDVRPYFWLFPGLFPKMESFLGISIAEIDTHFLLSFSKFCKKLRYKILSRMFSFHIFFVATALAVSPYVEVYTFRKV